MKSLTVKELKTALKVLEALDTDVPDEVFVAISDKIRQREQHLHDHRMAHLDEEQLMRLDNKVGHRLRITMPDGRIIQHKRNEETFLAALMQIAPAQLSHVTYPIHSRRLILVDETAQRKRIKGYRLLRPGLFVCSGTTLKEKKDALRYLDETLQLGWEMEMV